MTKLGVIIIVIWTLGAFLIIYNLGQVLLRRWRIKATFRNKEEEEAYAYILIGRNKRWQQFRATMEEKNSMAGTNWSFKTFISYTVILGLLGGLIGIRYLDNLATAIPLAIGFGIIPWAYISYFIGKKQRLMADQLVPAIQYFVSEYGAVPNVISALNKVANKISYPLSEEMDRLIMELNSGKDRELALFSFARRVNSHWAVRFAHLLNFKLTRGVDITPPLLYLYMDMKTKRIKEKERGMESAGIRLESYALYLFTPILYFLGTRINPEAHYLLTQTPQGKRVMFAIVVLAVGGVLSILKLNNNKVR